MPTDQAAVESEEPLAKGVLVVPPASIRAAIERVGKVERRKLGPTGLVLIEEALAARKAAGRPC